MAEKNEEPTDLALTRWETVVSELAAIRDLLSGRGPDLTLMEADIRGVATVVELTAELRRIRERLDLIDDRTAVLIAVGQQTLAMAREIALGLGVRP